MATVEDPSSVGAWFAPATIFAAGVVVTLAGSFALPIYWYVATGLITLGVGTALIAALEWGRKEPRAAVVGTGLVVIYGGLILAALGSISWWTSQSNEWIVAGVALIALATVVAIWLRYPSDPWPSGAAITIGLGAAVIVAGALDLDIDDADVAGEWALVFGIVVAAFGMGLFVDSTVPWLGRKPRMAGMGGIAIGGGITIAAGLGLLGSEGWSGFLTVNEWAMAGVGLAGFVLALWAGLEQGYPAVFAGVFGLGAGAFLIVAGILGIDEPEGKPAVAAGVAVAAVALAAWAAWQAKRWSWLLGLIGLGAGAWLITINALGWASTAPFGAALVVVVALLVAAFAFSRPVLRSVALLGVLGLAVLLASTSVTLEAPAEFAVAESGDLPRQFEGLRALVAGPDGSSIVVSLFEYQPDAVTVTATGQVTPIGTLVGAGVPEVSETAELAALTSGSRDALVVDPAAGAATFVDDVAEGDLVANLETGMVGIVLARKVFLLDERAAKAVPVAGLAVFLTEQASAGHAVLLVGSGSIRRDPGGSKLEPDGRLVAVDLVVGTISGLEPDREAGDDGEGASSVSAPTVIELSDEAAALFESTTTSMAAAPGGAKDLQQRVAEGADDLATRFISEATGESNAGTQLGVVGWVVLVILGLVFYRRLEVVNGRRVAGPVTVTEFKGEAVADHWQALLTQRVATEIHTPGSVPGAVTAAELGSVATELAGEARGKAVEAALKVIEKLGFPLRGYQLTALYQPAATGSAAGAGGHPTCGEPQGGDPSTDHRVAVTLSDARTGRVIAVQTSRGASAEETVERAAYSAANALLDRSKTQPEWARWTSPDGEALALYHRVTERYRPYHEEAHAQQLELEVNELERARAMSTGNALIRIELAYRYDQLDRRVDALREYLTVQSSFRRQWLARYRLAISLDLVACDVERAWFHPAVSSTTRREVVDQLRTYGSLRTAARTSDFKKDFEHLDPEERTLSTLSERMEKGSPNADDLRTTKLVMIHIGLLELKRVLGLLSTPQLAVNALKQSERSYWLGVLGRYRTRSQEVARTTVAQLKLHTSRRKVRLEHAPNFEKAKSERDAAHMLGPGVERLLRRSTSGWNARYNAACFYASLVAIDLALKQRSDDVADSTEELEGDIRKSTRRAIQLLREAINDPHSELPQSLPWVAKDPDLDPLRSADEFKQWIAQIMRAPG